MIPVPEIDNFAMAFGEVKHLPKWEKIPEKFKDSGNNTFWNKFISQWFFGGISKEAIEILSPKSGVDKNKALKAVGAILRSWEPKHEHKEAGAAYLMSEWFEEPKDGTVILKKSDENKPKNE